MSSNLPSNTIENLYKEVKQVIKESQNTVYRAANFAMIQAYWNIGRLIVEDEQKGEQRAEYGKATLKELSTRLTKEFGKSFSNRNLRYIRQFYQEFPNWNAVRSELSWTHYRLLLRVDNSMARGYYMQSAIEQHWSTRTLERQIHTQYYERVLSSGLTDVPEIPMKEGELELATPKDVIKDPFVLEFLDIKPNDRLQEKELESALMDELQSFLLELGKGFSFVGRQHRISLDRDHFYIDLVFYNYLLKCFVLIDLKTGKLTHQDIGQMDTYVRVFDDKMRQESDKPTIGLVLCAQKNNAIAKYSLLSESKQVFASEYMTHLPTEEELKRAIERGRHQIELEKKLDK